MQLNSYSPIYITGDYKNPLKELEKFISKNEIKRKLKEKAIKIGKIHEDEIWVKIGSYLLIIQKEFNSTANYSQMFWEYHYQLMPKIIKWETVKNI